MTALDGRRRPGSGPRQSASGGLAALRPGGPFMVSKKSRTGVNTDRVDTCVLQVMHAIEMTSQPVYVGQQLDVFKDSDTPALQR